MQILLSSTTILVLFAWAQAQVSQVPLDWSPFAGIEVLTQD